MKFACMVALVTPMNLDGQIDFEALSSLIDWHITSGTEALVVLGTTGESPTLSHEERTAIIKATIKQVNHRLPIFVGTGTYDTRHSIALSQEAEALGADGLLIITPYYNKPTQNGLYLHFKAINDAVNIPIILYNNSGRTGCHLEIETVHQLSQLKNIIGLKDTHPDLSRVPTLKKLCGKAFLLWSSCDNNSVAYVQAGGDGVISVIGNSVPSEMKQLMHYALENNLPALNALEKKLNPLIEASGLETNPIPIKYALYLMGKTSAAIRLPLTPLETEHHITLAKVLHDLQLIPSISKDLP
jgi:4-hydroxy-tetrahydrodipicolinate synthase